MRTDLPITIEVEDPLATANRIRGIREGLAGQRLKDAWIEALELVGNSARDKAPNWLGRLRASIEEEVVQDPLGTYGIVFTDHIEAPFQERGTDPFFPNLDNIEAYASAHGTTAYALALSIAMHGISAKHFFENALLENEMGIVDSIGGVIAEIVEEPY